MFPIVLSIKIWGTQLANKCITFQTDDQALSEVINKKTTKDRELLVLLCALVLSCLQNNILFKAVHFSGVHNTKADALSHLQVTKFKTLSKGMKSRRVSITDHSFHTFVEWRRFLFLSDTVCFYSPSHLSLKGKCSGAVLRLHEIINSVKRASAWLSCKAAGLGWDEISHIYWKSIQYNTMFFILRG